MRVVKRSGKFAVAVTESDEWINYADLSNMSLEDFLEEAKEYARENNIRVIVYVASDEYEIRP